ncbi:MAG: hypothetical protein JJT75_04290 [Opitutales bacterium]|nr:hypothetical protein [Opitutales bacterium]
MLELIPADCLSVSVTRFRTRMKAVAVESYGKPDFTKEHFEYYSRHAMEHPYSRFFVETGSGEAMRISDLVSTREWMKNPFWKFTLEWLDFRYGLLAVWPLGRNSIFNFDFERCRKDFSVRDKHLLNACLPILGRHYTLLTKLARWEASKKKRSPLSAQNVYAGQIQKLTAREQEVMQWLGNGKTNEEIAIILKIRPRTVQKHVENILRKLQLESRYAAATYAARVGG